MSTRSIVAGVASFAAIGAAQADTFGKLEHVRVVAPTPIEIVARLDSGNAATSLNAVDVKYFARDGGTWVRFTIDNGSVLPGNRVTLERLVLKDVKVRQPEGGVEHRPQVEVELCIGSSSFKSQLGLSDRRNYTAPLLIGTNDLSKLGSVDAGRQFTHEPNCVAKAAEQPVETR